MVDKRLRKGRHTAMVGRLTAILLLLLCGCSSKPPYTDRHYTPTGKVHFDSMGPRRSTAAEPVVQQPNSEDSTVPEIAANQTEEPSSDSKSEQSEETKSEETNCADEQASVLSLKTESYDITICETDGNLRYHGSYLPTQIDTELPALTSDNGYYVTEGSYEYWITDSSIAIYEGEELILEESAK